MEWREEIDLSCERVTEIVFLILLLLLLLSLLSSNNVFVVVVMMLQNCQVMVTSFGCCWYSGGAPQSPDCWSSCNVREKIGATGIEGESGIVMEDVCEDGMQNLGEGWC